MMYIVIKNIFRKYCNNYFSDEIWYWFDKKHYKFYDCEEIKKLGYFADTQEELIQILKYNGIIPSFSVNLYEFDKTYIDNFRNKKLSNYFSQFKDEKVYDSMFNIYTEENNIFYFGDLNKFYWDTAVDWCEKNNIRYQLE